jgi:hypothetical protein
MPRPWLSVGSRYRYRYNGGWLGQLSSAIPRSRNQLWRHQMMREFARSVVPTAAKVKTTDTVLKKVRPGAGRSLGTDKSSCPAETAQLCWPPTFDATFLFHGRELQIDAQRRDELISQRHKLESEGPVDETMPVQKATADRDLRSNPSNLLLLPGAPTEMARGGPPDRGEGRYKVDSAIADCIRGPMARTVQQSSDDHAVEWRPPQLGDPKRDEPLVEATALRRSPPIRGGESF